MALLARPESYHASVRDSRSIKSTAPGHVFTNLYDFKQDYYDWVPPSVRFQSIDELGLENLTDTDVGFFTTFAGVGHNRVCTDVATALHISQPNGRLRQKVEVVDTLAGKTHHAGSHDGLAKWWTEQTQQHFWAQWLVAGLIHELVLLKDSRPVLSAVHQFLRHSHLSKVALVAFHPDLAYILSYYKEQISRAYQKQIKVLVALTDHLPLRPQFIWYPTMADVIMTPDAGSAAVAQQQLEWWNRGVKRSDRKVAQLPQVETIPYPINPLLTRPLSRDRYAYRQAQLAPQSPIRPVVFMPLGGSAPQQKYLVSLTSSLPSEYDVRVLLKSGPATEIFEQNMRDHATIVRSSSSKDLIRNYLKYHYEHTAGLEIFKPSELHIKAVATPDQVGGTIIFLTNPVGDQEKQNVAWLQSKGLVPNHELHQQLWQAEPEKLQQLTSQAHHWRALLLPENPVQAGHFISRLKKAGVLAAMGRYEASSLVDSEVNPEGAAALWHALNQLELL